MKVEAVEIRKAGVNDVKHICLLLREFASEAGESLDSNHERRFKNAFLRQEQAKIHVWLAHFGGQAVGLAVLTVGYSSFKAQPSLFVEDLFVRREFRRMGVATGLLDRVRTQYQNEGFARLDITCALQSPLVSFYAQAIAAASIRACVRAAT